MLIASWQTEQLGNSVRHSRLKLSVAERVTHLSPASMKLGAALWQVPLWQPPSYCRMSYPTRVAELIDDSKRLTQKQRETAFEAVVKQSVSYGAGIVDAKQIDLLGIVPATKLAMRKAIRANQQRIDFLLIDAVERIGIATPSKSIIRGDSHSLSIAAASIIAKVTRDRIMSEEMETEYPGYAFAKHKGYGTAEHLKALEVLGPSVIHRRTFKPIAQMIADSSWSALGRTMSANIGGRSNLGLPDGLGKAGEDAAAEHLKGLGYGILERNYKTRVGEVDIVAKDGENLVFVEVKTRSGVNLGSPLESMTTGKLRRIENAALAYLASEVGDQDVGWRVDFLGITRSRDRKTLEFDLVRNVHY